MTRRLVVINVYCPRAEPGNAERLEYKLQFYRLLQLRAEAILDSGRLSNASLKLFLIFTIV